jgi:hypothetical protein
LVSSELAGETPASHRAGNGTWFGDDECGTKLPMEAPDLSLGGRRRIEEMRGRGSKKRKEEDKKLHGEATLGTQKSDEEKNGDPRSQTVYLGTSLLMGKLFWVVD